MNILFPCSYMDKNEVDEDYKVEYETAKGLGFKTLLFNYDEFIFMNKPISFNVISFEDYKGNYIYRGWMMNPSQYKKFYNTLSKKGIILINNLEEYKNTHEFVKPYKVLSQYTAETYFYGLDEKIDWKFIRNRFDKFIFKDYVKSVKGLDFPEYYDYTYSNVELDYYLNRFKVLRDNLLEGGIQVKEYLNLKTDKAGNKNEIRLWFYKGKCIHTSKHLNSVSIFSNPSKSWINKLPKLKSNFYTIDVAELKSNDWVVIETGDGQVSGYETEFNDREKLKQFYISFKN